jgi:broad specificity phosphatase PhoE
LGHRLNILYREYKYLTDACQARCELLLHKITLRHENQTVVLVGHAVVNGVIILAALDCYIDIQIQAKYNNVFFLAMEFALTAFL